MLKKRVAIQDFAAESRLFNHRAVFAVLFVVLMFGIIVFNQYQLQIVSYQDYQTRSEGNRIKVVPLAPNRGLIYDRSGILLAENRPVFSLELVPEQIKDMTATLAELATLIEFSAEQQDAFLKQVRAQRRFNSITLKEQLNDQEVAILAANQHRFPGVTVEARLSRHYPFGDLFTHALGYIGKINTRELQQLELDGEAANYAASRDIGKIGLERFYQRELQCGDRSKAYVMERSPGVFLLSVHVKDLSTVQLEFQGDDLKRRVGNPNIHSVLEYSTRTGVTRSLVKGGAKYHQMLLKAFAEHLLHITLDAQRLKAPTLDLSALRLGFDVPQAEIDGFNVLQVKSISLLSPDNQLKLDCTAMAASEHRCVTDLLAEKLPGPLADNWMVTAAQINLYYPPEPSKSKSKVITIEVTRKGRLNLHKFDEKLRAQLEGYLVQLGILKAQQVLKPDREQEQPQAVATSLFE